MVTTEVEATVVAWVVGTVVATAEAEGVGMEAEPAVGMDYSGRHRSRCNPCRVGRLSTRYQVHRRRKHRHAPSRSPDSHHCT